MAGVVKKNFGIFNAAQFKEAFDEANPSRVYLFVGGVQPFANDSNVPTPIESTQTTDYDIFRSLIAAKKVRSTDVSHSIPRYNWVSGTVYTEYDNRRNLFANNFYVYTDDRNVYKCLFNNKGAASTNKPTGTPTSQIITQGDGYKWKYMYTISGAEENKFATAVQIPVKVVSANDGSSQFTVQQAAVNGNIEISDVRSGGTGYLYNTGTITATTNSAVMRLATSANTVDDAYVGSVLYIDSGLGAGLSDEIINYTGSTREVTLRTGLATSPNTSTTYIIGPKVTITGDGTGATAYANVSGSGAVNYVNMIDRGQNYSKANITITANTGTGANAVAYISPSGGHGSKARDELGGSNIMVNVILDGLEANTIPANNDFRVFGLIADPLLADGTVANNVNYEFTTRLTLTGATGGFVLDEKITGATSGATANVVSFANTNATGTNGVLRILNIDGNFSSGENITSSGGTSAGVSSIKGSDLQFFKGNVLYVEHRSPIVRDSLQTEDFKLNIAF